MKMTKFDLLPFVWFWKIVARRKYNRMMDIQDSLGVRFNTVNRLIGASHYNILSDEVDEIISWCKRKEGEK